MRATVGLAIVELCVPVKNDFAFHVAFVTVPSPSLRMNPASPTCVPYSSPVAGWALSLANTAIVIGYSGRIFTDTLLCGRKSIESIATIFPLMKITHQLSAQALSERAFAIVGLIWAAGRACAPPASSPAAALASDAAAA